MDYRNTDCYSQCAHWFHNDTWQGVRCGGRPQGSPLRKHKGCNASPGGTVWASSPTDAQHEVRTEPAQRCYPGGSVGFFGTGKGSGIPAAAIFVLLAAAAGKSPKRRRWRMQRGDFEEVPRLVATTVAGNRLARRCYPGGSVIFRDRERVRRFCRSNSYTFYRSRREIAEAPPVADAARRFRGSAPIGRHDSAGESAGTTVLPRRLSRIFRDRERVRRFCRSSSYTFYRSRRGTGRYGRSSAPGGAAFSRCRHRRCSRRWPWLPARA